MTTQTSYRIRMRTRHVDDIAGAMRPISELNTTEAREARLSWWDTPALFGRMRTFGPHIHQQQPEGPGFWSWRDGELILAFDAVGMERVDGRPVGTHRRSIIFDVLSSLCDESEGTIVGGIQYEHSYDWNPIIVHDGRLRIGYVSGSELGDKERTLAVQPRIIDPDRITASDEESVHVRDVD